MKDKVFRPVSFWKSACISMPDNSFFELLRSVFGKIKTPFNKQQLLNDLEHFLLREDIQKTISAYIDENDSKIITAVALFGEPSPGQLENFFSNDFSNAELQDLIVNMEERFLIYRFIEDKSNPVCNRLALNPVLKTVLFPFTKNTSMLFPFFNSSAEKELLCSTKIIFNDLVLAGILSFASQWQPFYKAEGIRKRVIEAGKTCFQEINLNNIIGGLLVLGLFYIDNENLVCDMKHLNEFNSLSIRERKEYYAASLAIYKESYSLYSVNHTQILPPLYKNKIREIINWIHSFIDTLKTDYQYPESTLKKILEIIKTQTALDTRNGFNINSSALAEAMEHTGLIINTTPNAEKGKKIFSIANTQEKKHAEHDNEKALIAFDSNISILVYPEISFCDAISLSSFMNIKEYGTISRFELDRDSVLRAFNNNINSEEIISLLNKLSCKKADETLIWNLKDWEKRYGEVSLKKGVILKLSEEHRYLTETMPLSELIIETLAPGLYLLDESSNENAAEALRNAGIDIIAQLKQRKQKTVFIRNNEANSLFTSSFKNFPSPSIISIKDIFLTDETANTTGTAKASGAAKTAGAEFHAILKKLPISDSERKELSARIDRRLVVCEMQLKETDIRYEKIEARHMDYSGKQNIAKQAIIQKSPVEIIWPRKNDTSGAAKQEAGSKTDEEKIFGIPKALEKEGNELFLIVVPDGENDGKQKELLRIPLAKISLLRRIKKSIFEK
ncbi:MAG: hypothetical protein FWB86_06455 [Treponema sp.]|nr:hypothetical protein [Treponema sp.]MCL2250887.1 hypothetical protein [Treponema sp.]